MPSASSSIGNRVTKACASSTVRKYQAVASRQARRGAVDGVAAAADLGVEPAVHVEEQVLEAALRHQYLDAHRKRMVVDPLLRRASPVPCRLTRCGMFMICSERATRARASVTRGSVPVDGDRSARAAGSRLVAHHRVVAEQLGDGRALRQRLDLGRRLRLQLGAVARRPADRRLRPAGQNRPSRSRSASSSRSRGRRAAASSISR